jgi:hypothetical protein
MRVTASGARRLQPAAAVWAERGEVVAAARGSKPAGAHHDDFRSQVQKIVDKDKVAVQ